jgi:hypothetical protein
MEEGEEAEVLLLILHCLVSEVHPFGAAAAADQVAVMEPAPQ